MKIRGKTRWPPLSAAIVAIAVASFAVGSVVRVFAARNDLWFDEIWTLELLRERVHSFGDVFTNIKHSNNHHLCSLWMWIVGQNASALVYRLPSVLASIGTVVLAGLIGLRQSRLEGCIAVILTSWSYLLIHFGTEARGYSLAIFFALLAWYALQQFEETVAGGDDSGRSWSWAVVFWCAVVLGFLAHLEFVVCFAGLLVWSLWRFARARPNWRQAVLDLFALFTVPVVLLLFFYFVAIRGMEVGGGPPYQFWPLLIKTGSYMLGGPGNGIAAAIVSVVTTVAVYAVLVYLIRDRDDRWIFYAVVILAPLALLALKRPEQLYVRYFMISVAMSLLLLAAGWAAIMRRGLAGLVTGLVLLAIFVTGNVINTVNLLRFGRGQYLAAMRFMETHSNGEKVVITSSQDFSNGMLVKYFKRYLDRPDSVQYVDQATLKEEYARTNGSASGAEWLILHLDHFDLTTLPARVTDAYGNSFRLVKIYQYSDLSGSHWLLYHNLNRPPVAPQSPLLR